MEEQWKPLEGGPLSRLFLIELGILTLFLLLSFLAFGFGYGERIGDKQQIFFQGILTPKSALAK